MKGTEVTTSAEERTDTMTKRQENIELVKRFYDKVYNAQDISNLDQFMKDDYIQHNPYVADGKEGFIEFAKTFPTLKPKMEVVKAFANDNDEVAVFVKATCEGEGQVNKIVDIFRMEDGLLAEHWDVDEYDISDAKAQNGRDQFSTDAESTPTPGIADQQANIDKVAAFINDVLGACDISELDEFMSDDYMQHNADTADGRDGFIKFTEVFFPMEPEMRIYKTFANEDGEVLAFFKCTCKANDTVNKLAYMFRLQDGKLVEHWDVIEYDIGNVQSKSGRDLFE
jgi:predicted SnoaL-like aldol condensation-catalyzing enzyme